MNLPKLIVIDDEIDLAGFVCDVAKQAGFDAEQYNKASIFMAQYSQCADIIVLDLMMPEIDGIEIIRFLAKVQYRAQLILMSGFDSGVLHSAQKLATEHGLNLAGCLNKPFRAHQLEQLLSGLITTTKYLHCNAHIEPPNVDELRDALTKDELVVHYQPKIGLNGNAGKVVAVEALVRWQHPERGLIAPDLFIPIAEQHKLIDNLTQVVLKQSLVQCKSWHDQGLNMQLAINMSANTLKELDLPERMGNLIVKHGLQPKQVIIEITEFVLMQELIKSLDILTRLRMKGIRLSIDDFGTGYSSLVQLHRLPFSEIKIDRSFVAEMESDSEAATIVETIIMLAQKLHMKSIAEGVETESCQKKLTELGCDQAQGYLFAKPMPANEVFPWFSENLKGNASMSSCYL